MENPALWVWAIVVGLIIAGKYAYRWKTTKELAKEIERRDKGIGLSKDIPDNAIKNNNNIGSSTSNVKTTMSHKYSHHKYSPSSYRDYFGIRKSKVKVKS